MVCQHRHDKLAAQACRKSQAQHALFLALQNRLILGFATAECGFQPCFEPPTVKVPSNEAPGMVPGSIPNVLSTPRIWFDKRVVMPTSYALAPSRARVRWASSDFTCTERYHPTRMIWASPSASF